MSLEKRPRRSAPNEPVKQAIYTSFGVDAAAAYTLQMSGQTVTLGPGEPGIYTSHNGRPWSTVDVDNDNADNHHNWGAIWLR